jgi:hypothetical protein
VADEDLGLKWYKQDFWEKKTQGNLILQSLHYERINNLILF